jgi:HEAT repeat protein
VTKALWLTVILLSVLGPENVSCRSPKEQPKIALKKVFHDLVSKDVKVQRAAVNTLVEIASSRAGDAAIRKNLKVLGAIVGKKQKDPEIRGQVVRAISIISERKRIEQAIIPGLIKILLDEAEEEDVRSWLATSLADLAPPEVAGPAILKAARSRNKVVRRNAAGALDRVRLDPEKLLKWLTEAITDSDASIRRSAVGTAAQFCRRDERFRPIVLLGFADHDVEVRGEAIAMVLYGNVLGADAKGAKEAVEKLLKDRDPRVAMSAAATLTRISPKDSSKYLALLIRGLEHNKVETREAAAQVLVAVLVSGLREKEAQNAVPSLKKALKDSSDLLKAHAAMALGLITGEKSKYVSISRDVGRSSRADAMMMAKAYELLLLGNGAKRSRKKEKK